MHRSRTGTVIAIVNIVPEAAVVDPAASDPRVVGVRRFRERLASEPRLRATTFPTVGCQRYDGFSLAVVVGPAPAARPAVAER